MAKVTIKDLCKKFDETVVVDKISMEILDKEFLVLVGPSGCGKTTTLRMIAGLEEVTSGEIFIDGNLVNELSPKDRDIAMVFQNYALYPHMDVFNNMAYGLKMRKFPKDEIGFRVQDTAESLGLTEFLHRKPKELSGGQRQRVALGRAIVREPKVFLMDEPLSNLDAKLRNQTRTELKKLHERLKTTIVYVTHDQIEAMTLGDRIVVMNDGKIQQIGTPYEIYNNPDNLFVAGFIGSPQMNFVACRYARKKDLTYIRNDAFELPLPDNAWQGIADGRELILGIRPEDIYEDESYRSKFPEWTMRATVNVVEPLGNETFLHLNLGNSKAVLRASNKKQFRPGDLILVTIDLPNAHLFDAKSEIQLRRI